MDTSTRTDSHEGQSFSRRRGCSWDLPSGWRIRTIRLVPVADTGKQTKFRAAKDPVEIEPPDRRASALRALRRSLRIAHRNTPFANPAAARAHRPARPP